MCVCVFEVMTIDSVVVGGHDSDNNDDDDDGGSASVINSVGIDIDDAHVNERSPLTIVELHVENDNEYDDNDTMHHRMHNSFSQKSPCTTTMSHLEHSQCSTSGKAIMVARSTCAGLGFGKIDVVEFFSSAADDDLDQTRMLRMMSKHLARIRPTDGRIVIGFNKLITTFKQGTWALLISIGLSTALVSYIIDLLIQELQMFTRSLSLSSSSVFIVNWMVFTLISVISASLAVACVLYISPHSKGSGIPEMKSILGGNDIAHYLDLKVLAAKVPGTIFALSSGLSVGKEGSFVHIATILANQIGRFPCFSNAVRFDGARRKVIAAAIAAGVTATFGAPLGGTLFSIEVTATSFTVSSMWQTFATAVTCVFAYQLCNAFYSVYLFEFGTITPLNFEAEIFLFIILGLMCGILGAIFTYLSATWMDALRRKYTFSWIYQGHMRLVLCAAFFTAILRFPLPIMRKPDHIALNHLFQQENQDVSWHSVSGVLSLLYLGAFRLILTSLSITLPVPAGVFAPIFLTGGAFGRAFGEMVNAIIPSASPAAAYSIAGAAAVVSGATQSLSTAVIVCELAGDLRHFVPVIFVCLIARAIAHSLQAASIYDILLEVRRLPHLPKFRLSRYKLTARNVMRNHGDIFMTPMSTKRDIVDILSHPQLDYSHIPVVKDAQSMQLLGSMSVSRLDDLAASFGDTLSDPNFLIMEQKELMDPAPFQIVSATPLAKVHYLFSLLGLQQSLVSERGNLVGIITHKELAK